jgi:SAM-dependent methyltransferase
MSAPAKSQGHGYDDWYKDFDSALLRQVRREAYGKDIGQHSWVSAKELEEDISRLKLSAGSRFLDLGCGPCGPLAFIVSAVRCHGSGVDSSAPAIAAGRARIAALGLDALAKLQQADLNEPLSFAKGSFEAVVSVDVILHLRDRAKVFREVARVLSPGGKFLFTDAGVITGVVSEEEMQARAAHGYTQFIPPGGNEKLLESAGFHLIEQQDRTSNLLRNAKGRREARRAHKTELEQVEGAARFACEQRYLETVVALAERGALSRMMYLAETRCA